MENIKPIRKRKVLLTGFGIFLLSILAFTVFFFFNFHTVEVKGPSMEPTFNQGQRLLVSKAYWLVGSIHKNDIIVVKSGDEYIIKRVYALGGEKVDLFNIPENYSLINGEYVVPKDKYYILGDNRPMSEDSRHFGPVEAKEILGKVIVIGFGAPPAKSGSN